MGLQKYRFDVEGEPYSNGGIPIYTRWMGGPTLAGVKNCTIDGLDCSPRTAYVQGEPDTFFSIPAKIRVLGTTVTGFLAVDSDAEDSHDLVFHPHTDSAERVRKMLLERQEARQTKEET